MDSAAIVHHRKFNGTRSFASSHGEQRGREAESRVARALGSAVAGNNNSRVADFVADEGMRGTYDLNGCRIFVNDNDVALGNVAAKL